MAGMWQKTLFYLGLVDEDDPGYEAEAAGSYAATEEPPLPARQQASTLEPRDPESRQESSWSARPEQPQQPATGVTAGRRVEPPTAARRRTVSDRALSDAGVIVTSAEGSTVRTVTERDLESEIITARSYSDAQLLADQIRASIPVVLDLRQVEPAMVRRLVDFASGLTYALGGSMRKIGQGVILVTPANVNITRDERRRLESLGYHQAPEGS
jgi:cell division inhibitor SepF